MKAARLGVLGGTFDPIHLGHLDAARAARRALDLGEVVFVPAHVPPHRDRPRASGYHRLAMVALAIQSDPGFVVSDAELTAGGPSYTARTFRGLHAEGWAPSQIFFITGVDAFAEIASWHAYPAVMDAANFVVVSRPGFSQARLGERLPDLAPRFLEVAADGRDAARAGGVDTRTRVFLVAAATTDVSSTEVRARLAGDGALDGLVPPPVADYARRHRLYVSALGAAGLLHGEE